MAEAGGELVVEEGGLRRTLKDLFSGAAGGVAQVLIGQPFDIIKVRLQTTTQYPSALSAATSIYRTEGPLAFYKGTLTPLIGIGACVSIQFGAFNYARRALESHNASSSSSGSTTTSPTLKPPQLSYTQFYAAGAFAGLSNTILSAPIEHVRIRLQTQPHGAAKLYTGPLDCARQLIRSSGLGNGLYRGFNITLLREAQAYGLWFLTFEYLMTKEAQRSYNGERKAVPAWKVALAGGIAGEALWIGSYPFDVVKSRVQSDGFGKPGERNGIGGERKYTGNWDCAVKTWKGEGVRGFWKGLAPTLVRAMPVSAGTFAVVEMTMRAMG